MFKVQRKQCLTCIYKKNSPLDLAKLEADIADPCMIGYFIGYRICHHSKDACCAGFWAKHKDNFTSGQFAQRFDMIEYVDEDIHKGIDYAP